VLKRIEEQVEALEAKKLRLGGKIEKAKNYHFEHALMLFLDFLKDPKFIWGTGNLAQRHMVLRLVFTEPLVYDRETGFGTATFSLPINLACVLELVKWRWWIRRDLNLRPTPQHISVCGVGLPTEPTRSILRFLYG
jgi:hypothetical protein